MFASDGMRPDLMEKYAEGRLHADLQGADEGRASPATTGCSRPSRRTPASAGTRWRPARTRPTTARPTTRTSGAVTPSRTGRRSRPPDVLQADTIATPPSGPARRSPRSTGSAARPPTSTARPSTSRTSSRTAACSSAQADPVEQAGSAFFGVTYQVADALVAGDRLDQRPDRRPGRAAEGDDLDDQLDVRGAEPEPHLQRLLLRQRHRRRRELRPRDRQPRRQDGREPVGRPQGRRLPAASSSPAPTA